MINAVLLIHSMLEARNKYIAAASAIDAAIAAIDAVTPTDPEAIAGGSGEPAPGTLFPVPHGDPS